MKFPVPAINLTPSFFTATALGTKVTESHYGEFNLSSSGPTSPIPPWMTSWRPTTKSTTSHKPPAAYPPVWPPTTERTTTRRPVWPPTTERTTTRRPFWHSTTQRTTTRRTTWWWTPPTTTTTTTTERPETTTRRTTRRPETTTSAFEDVRPPSSGPKVGDSCRSSDTFPSASQCSKYLR